MKTSKIIINPIIKLFFLFLYITSGITMCHAQFKTELINIDHNNKNLYLTHSNSLAYHIEFDGNNINSKLITNTSTKQTSDENQEKNCKEIKKRIDFIKIILKTFADKSLRDKIKKEGGEIKEYKEAVRKRVMSEAQSENKPSGKATTLMETHPNLTITGDVDGENQILITYNAEEKEINETKYLTKFRDNYIKKYGEKVGPCKVNAMIEHEKCHLKQFVDLKHLKSIDDLANRELEAYRIELNNLKKCFRKSLNCCDLPSMQDVCSTWQGSLSLSVTKRYQCNVKEQGSEIKADDIDTQKVNVTIDMDDFNFTKSPSIPGTHLIRNASGEMTRTLNEDHFTSSGDCNTNHDTSIGHAFRKISKGNINLLIVKDMELNEGDIKGLQQQMQRAAQNKDYATVQKLKVQMVNMGQGGQNINVIPISIRIEISFGLSKDDLITRSFYHKRFDAHSRICKENSDTITSEISLALPIGAVMKGTYTKEKDGADTITATINTTVNSYVMFGSEKCPDAISIISGEINLTRK